MSEPIVTDKKVEKALDFLADTDEELAKLKADVGRTEHLAKVAEALAFKLADGNNEERKAEARVADQVQERWEAHFKAVGAFEMIRAKRERAAITIDLWRSLQANRRMGHVQ